MNWFKSESNLSSGQLHVKNNDPPESQSILVLSYKIEYDRWECGEHRYNAEWSHITHSRYESVGVSIRQIDEGDEWVYLQSQVTLSP
jgi:hypothetical protein